MTAVNRASLYQYFLSGAKPTQSQFANLIDSCLNLVTTSAQFIASDVTVSGQTNIAGQTSIADALILGSAAGGNKGAGTINATNYYINGTLLTVGSAAGSGTVTPGTAGQLAFYSTSTNTVVGTSALPSGITAVTGSAGSGGLSIATQAYADRTAIVSQNDVTISRALNTVYQNTTGKTMYINVVCGDSGGSVAYLAKTDSANPPTTNVAAGTFNTNIALMTLSFMVLNNNFYEIVESGGSPSLNAWIEWF